MIARTRSYLPVAQAEGTRINGPIQAAKPGRTTCVVVGGFLSGLLIAWLIVSSGQTGIGANGSSNVEKESTTDVSTLSPVAPETVTKEPVDGAPSFSSTSSPSLFPTSKRSQAPTLVPHPQSTPKPTIPLSSSYEIDDATAQMWSEFEQARLAAVKHPGFDYAKTFCPGQLHAHPTLNKIKYEFPPNVTRYAKNNPDGFNMNADELLQHVTQYLYALANHYHYVRLDDIDAVDFGAGEGKEASLNRIASSFYNKLKRVLAKKERFTINYGFHGSSVMSGQDNCYVNTLAPLTHRTLTHLFAPLNPDIVVRNQGQNGDSPEQSMTLMCSMSTMNDDDLDFLHLWMPMMPQAQFTIKENFVRSWFTYSKRLAFMTQAKDPTFPLERFAESGFLATIRWAPGNMKLDWTAPYGQSVWGSRGDGFCRMDTREGEAGIVMQNWHAGPMGFQFYADGIAVLMALAMQRALQWLAKPSSFELPSLPSVPLDHSNIVVNECTGHCAWKVCWTQGQAQSPLWSYQCTPGKTPPRIVCVTGNGPQFTTEADLKTTWHGRDVPDDDPAIVNVSTPWKWTQVKFLSSIHSAAEQTERNYQQRPECSAFLDIGFYFESYPLLMTNWLEVQWDSRANNRLAGAKTMNMYVCHGQRYPARGWDSVPGKGWVMDVKVGGKTVNPNGFDLVTGKINWLFGCILANLDPLPVPQKAGTTFSFRMRKANTTMPTTSAPKVGIGNVFFIAAD